MRLRLDGVLAHGEVSVLLRLLSRLRVGLRRGQPPADGAGLLGPEVKGQVLLARVRLAKVLELVLANHSKNLGNLKPHNLDLRQLVGGTTSDLGHAESRKLSLQLLELLLGERKQKGKRRQHLSFHDNPLVPSLSSQFAGVRATVPSFEIDRRARGQQHRAQKARGSALDCR